MWRHRGRWFVWRYHALLGVSSGSYVRATLPRETGCRMALKDFHSDKKAVQPGGYHLVYTAVLHHKNVVWHPDTPEYHADDVRTLRVGLFP